MLRKRGFSGRGKFITGLVVAAGCLLHAIAGHAQSTTPASITLSGTIRDFNSNGTSTTIVENGRNVVVDGHKDFEFNPCCKSGKGIVKDKLGNNRKPEFNNSNLVSTKANFDKWYTDDKDYNRSRDISIRLDRVGTSNVYRFTSKTFFPIDGELLRQVACCGHNYGFTTEWHTSFTHVPSNNAVFSFSGDDDVWVFINDKLAIDLGGVHGEQSQTVNINDIASAHGLVTGRTYNIDVFHAERHTSGSNFTISTTLQFDWTPAVPLNFRPEATFDLSDKKHKVKLEWTRVKDDDLNEWPAYYLITRKGSPAAPIRAAWNLTSYVDDNTGIGFSPGIEICYTIQACYSGDQCSKIVDPKDYKCVTTACLE